MNVVNPIMPLEAEQLLAAGRAVLIDVREPDEFSAGHIPYAASMPLAQAPALLDRMPLGNDMTVIFQCQKGARGGQACVAAPAALAGRVRNMEGGIEAWAAAGLPVAGGRTPRVSIFRQVQMIVGLLVLACTLAGLAGFALGFYLAALFGGMLAFAGISGWCGLALLLQRLPWNRAAV